MNKTPARMIVLAHGIFTYTALSEDANGNPVRVTRNAAIAADGSIPAVLKGRIGASERAELCEGVYAYTPKAAAVSELPGLTAEETAAVEAAPVKNASGVRGRVSRQG